jgi:lipopolysaccharide transport system ATP-binding protein
MRTVIRVENLSKKFRIGRLRKDEGTLRDDLLKILTHPFRRQNNEDESNTLWALKDVSFDIKSGDILGIIGSNGAGKSTLLKILSRITKPTLGRVEIDGRVGSLLEVGTGFHQDLTGRENVFLNGSVLGMRRSEVRGKFDEIVGFAEIDNFIDTPVKFYSSGMYARLAFSVAAHLDPEILIVDEVLSVGDAAFQEKSLGKMKQLVESGRTVIFVSHNGEVIKQMCNKGLYLDKGKLKDFGDMKEVFAHYQSDTKTNTK